MGLNAVRLPSKGSIASQGYRIESNVLEKLPLEKSMILVADSMADFIDREICFQDELLGRVHSPVDEILYGWLAVLLGKNTAELGGGKPGLASQLLDSPLSSQIGIN